MSAFERPNDGKAFLGRTGETTLILQLLSEVLEQENHTRGYSHYRKLLLNITISEAQIALPEADIPLQRRLLRTECFSWRIAFFHAARWRRFFRSSLAASNFRSRSA
jgi:hypothetical protein